MDIKLAWLFWARHWDRVNTTIRVPGSLYRIGWNTNAMAWLRLMAIHRELRGWDWYDPKVWNTVWPVFCETIPKPTYINLVTAWADYSADWRQHTWWITHIAITGHPREQAAMVTGRRTGPAPVVVREAIWT